MWELRSLASRHAEATVVEEANSSASKAAVEDIRLMSVFVASAAAADQGTLPSV